MNPDQEKPLTPRAHDDALSQAYFRDRNVADQVAAVGDVPRSLLRKLILRTLVVLLLLGGLDLVIRRYYSYEKILPYMKLEAIYYTVKLRHYLDQPTPDVLVMGSSRARRGVNPEPMAAKLSDLWKRPARVYNMGFDGGLINEIHAFARSHIQDPAPPYVILCLSGQEITQAYEFYYAPRFLWRFPDMVNYLKTTSLEQFEVKKLEYYLESILGRIWYLFDFRDAISLAMVMQAGSLLGLESIAYKAEEMKNSSKRRVDMVLAEDGYFSDPFRSMTMAERLEKAPDTIPRISDKRRALDRALFENPAILVRLEQVITLLQEKGAKVALAELPPSPLAQAQRSALGGVDFRKWFRKQAGVLGVPFVPCPTWASGLGNEHYIDTSHLSNEGSVIYSQFLVKRLLDMAFFGEKAP